MKAWGIDHDIFEHNDFANRIGTIIKIIKEKNPDVICLQEEQIDEKYSSFSQVENLKIVVSLSCPHCPHVVTAAQQMAISYNFV